MSAGLTLLGKAYPGGTYLLRMQVARTVAVQYGRFSPQPIATNAGEVVYLGSALGQRGASTLARRLLRHAARSGGLPPHPIGTELESAFGLSLPLRKTLRWHVDYLLQETAVALTHILAIRSPQRLEPALGQWLNQQPHLHPVAPGLGASDARHVTHLLYSATSLDEWWAMLPEAVFR